MNCVTKASDFETVYLFLWIPKIVTWLEVFETNLTLAFVQSMD